MMLLEEVEFPMTTVPNKNKIASNIANGDEKSMLITLEIKLWITN